LRDDLIKAEGKAAFEERQEDSMLLVECIEAGLLRRALFMCE
jgi:hypothetical protein